MIFYTVFVIHKGNVLVWYMIITGVPLDLQKKLSLSLFLYILILGILEVDKSSQCSPRGSCRGHRFESLKLQF